MWKSGLCGEKNLLVKHIWEKTMKIACRYIIFMGIIAMSMLAKAFGQPMAGQEKAWDRHDLIAKVIIRSIDMQREIQYINTPQAQAFGYPLDYEMVEPMRMPLGSSEVKIIVPAYCVVGGRKIPSLQMSNGAISISNTLAITCHYYDNPEYLAIEGIVSNEAWTVYQRQKEVGASPSRAMPELCVEPDKQEQVKAILKQVTLRRQMRKGEITEEEFKRQNAVLDEVIQTQISQTSNHSSMAESVLQNDTDMQARVNAFQKKTLLRGDYEDGTITKNEYDRQTVQLDEVIDFPGTHTSMVTPEHIIMPDIRVHVEAFRQSMLLRRRLKKGEITEEEFQVQSDSLHERINAPVENRWAIQ